MAKKNNKKSTSSTGAAAPAAASSSSPKASPAQPAKSPNVSARASVLAQKDISPAVSKILNAMFKSITDGKETCDAKHLQSFGCVLRDHWKTSSSELLLNMMDANHDKQVSSDEFVHFMVEIISLAFTLIDKDNSGFLDFDEMVPISKNFMKNWTPWKTELFMRRIDSDENKRIEPREFAEFVATECFKGLEANEVRHGLLSLLSPGFADQDIAPPPSKHGPKRFVLRKLLACGDDDFLTRHKLKDREFKNLMKIKVEQIDEMVADFYKSQGETRIKLFENLNVEDFNDEDNVRAKVDASIQAVQNAARVSAARKEVKALKAEKVEQEREVTSSSRDDAAHADVLRAGASDVVKKHLRNLFDELDDNMDGQIDSAELEKLGKMFKPKWKKRNNKRLMAIMDTDHNNAVDPDEFATFIFAILSESFDALDLDGSGNIDFYELIPVCKAFRKKWTQKKNQSFLHSIDTDGDGQISRAEFCDFIIQECFAGLKKGDIASGIRKLSNLNAAPSKDDGDADVETAPVAVAAPKAEQVKAAPAPELKAAAPAPAAADSGRPMSHARKLLEKLQAEGDPDGRRATILELLRQLAEKEEKLQKSYDDLITVHKSRVQQYEEFMKAYQRFKDTSLLSTGDGATAGN